MVKILYSLICLVLLVSLVSADIDLGRVRQNNCVTISKQCIDCTYNNLTTIVYPNQSNAFLGNAAMTKNVNYYNYSFCGNTAVGTYYVYGYDNNLTWRSYYTVTPNGDEYTIASSITYSIIVFLSLALFAFAVWASIRLDASNQRDEEGYIIKVSLIRKQLKLFFLVMSYAIATWLFFVMWNITAAYVNFLPVSKFFYMLFRILLVAAWPITLLYLIFGVIIFIRDKKLSDEIERGLHYRR